MNSEIFASSTQSFSEFFAISSSFLIVSQFQGGAWAKLFFPRKQQQQKNFRVVWFTSGLREKESRKKTFILRALIMS